MASAGRPKKPSARRWRILTGGNVIRWGLKFAFLGACMTLSLLWLSRPAPQPWCSTEGSAFSALVAAHAAR